MFARTAMLAVLAFSACSPPQISPGAFGDAPHEQPADAERKPAAAPKEPPVLMMNRHKERDRARVDSKRAQLEKFEALVPHKDSTPETLASLDGLRVDLRKELERLEQWVELCRGMPDVPL
jgi:hypothetical protein